ncbi:uncharacterized protein JN550_000952 [Neoarthrinium moseri]|uniref:uncharacterized protein n=1 Tax=Neoarthrinium moseri TaxID=1658444 RepID=UPI001FDAD193|nr:uncharacterized protein JN550_000952 [Neoarthrinium moseri]KAI1876880.1 hypothetical protein JN550_000952 [Neoarthrinium moseri]
MTTTTTTNEPSSFSLFSALPPELRVQVWDHALPYVGPALHFYKKGYWRLQHLTEADVDYDPHDEDNLHISFRHDLLDDVRFELPSTFVNREAHDVTLAWLRDHGIQVRRLEDGESQDEKCSTFVRLFDPKNDILFVEFDKWEDFICEPDDRHFEPDIQGKMVSLSSDLTQIALPEALLLKEADTLPELFRSYFNVRVLFVIINEQPELQHDGDSTKPQAPWKVDSAQGGAFAWNPDRGAFDFTGSDKTQCSQIESVIQRLGKEIPQNHIHRFEVRPVLAVKG